MHSWRAAGPTDVSCGADESSRVSARDGRRLVSAVAARGEAAASVRQTAGAGLTLQGNQGGIVMGKRICFSYNVMRGIKP